MVAHVHALAERVRTHIQDTSAEIAAIHVHGAESLAVQTHFARLLRLELGFGEEVMLTPRSGS